MNAAVVLLQATGVAVVLLGLFRAREDIGFAPLYVFVGVLQVLQAFSAGAFVELWPGLQVSVGSTVLFPATLSAILAVYIREDALETRKLIFGLLIGNSAAAALSASIGWGLGFGDGSPASEFLQSHLGQGGRVLFIGTLLLVADALLVPVVYESVAQRGRRLPLVAKVLIALLVVLAFDALAFVTLVFGRDPDFAGILRSALVGKGLAAVHFAILLSVYLRWFDRWAEPSGPEAGRRGAWAVLTYRERFERLQEVAVRDGLTGVLNRAYFDESLEHELASGLRYERTTALLLVDVDHFKRVNDRHGHQAGDDVLRQIGGALQEASRDADVVCRYGGEEFALILPAITRGAAIGFAERLRGTVAGLRFDSVPDLVVTCSLGVAIHPEDGETASDLVAVADARLYEAKAAGRNAVVGA